MKTETSKTLKACTFDNIQCLRLLKAGSAKCSCITHKPAGKTITGLSPGPMFHMIRYGSYTGILHREKKRKQKKKNSKQTQMLVEHHMLKQVNSFTLQCNVPTDKSHPHRSRLQTPPTSACMRTKSPFRNALLPINLWAPEQATIMSAHFNGKVELSVSPEAFLYNFLHFRSHDMT